MDPETIGAIVATIILSFSGIYLRLNSLEQKLIGHIQEGLGNGKGKE